MYAQIYLSELPVAPKLAEDQTHKAFTKVPSSMQSHTRTVKPTNRWSACFLTCKVGCRAVGG